MEERQDHATRTISIVMIIALVGKVLGMAQYYGEYPCHRVVNHAGRLVPGWYEQRRLLLEEGITMKDDTHVDMKKCRWDMSAGI